MEKWVWCCARQTDGASRQSHATCPWRFIFVHAVALAMTGSYRPAPDPLIPGLTLSLTTQFLASATLDDQYLVAEARRTGGGRSVFFADGAVRASSGRIIATASGVFKPSRPPK